MTEIVKVQRPLMTNGDEPVWLVYAEGRKNMTQIAESDVPMQVRLAMGHDFKGHFEADWMAGGWAFGVRVEDRDW